jgi:hypothetical protein
MGNTSIDDVHRIDATFGSIQGTADLGQHASTDRAVGKKLVNLPSRANR